MEQGFTALVARVGREAMIEHTAESGSVADARVDEGRMQRRIVALVGDAQVAAGKLAARERLVCGPRAPLADRARPEQGLENACCEDPHRAQSRSGSSSSRSVRK